MQHQNDGKGRDAYAGPGRSLLSGLRPDGRRQPRGGQGDAHLHGEPGLGEGRRAGARQEVRGQDRDRHRFPDPCPPASISTFSRPSSIPAKAPTCSAARAASPISRLQYNVEKNAVDLTDEPWAAKEDKLVAAQSTLGRQALRPHLLGHVLGNTWVISYNKKLFAQYGLSAPKTYAEFKAACQKLARQRHPADLRAGRRWLAPRSLVPRTRPALRTGHARPCRCALNANKATFAGDPTMLSAVTQLKEMFDLGYMGQERPRRRLHRRLQGDGQRQGGHGARQHRLRLAGRARLSRDECIRHRPCS